MKVVTIGRSQDNDYVINDPSVSRHHSQIVLMDDGKVMILDMGSANGTYVNDRKISGEVMISSTDRVRFGKVEVDWTMLFPSATADPADKNVAGVSNRIWLIIVSVIAGVLLLVCAAVIIYYSKEKSKAEDEITSLTEENEMYKENVRSSQDESARQKKYQKELSGKYSDALEYAKKQSENDRLTAEKDIARAKMVSDSIRKELDSAQEEYRKFVKSSAESEKSLRKEMEARISDLSEQKAAADAALEGTEKELSAMKARHQEVIDNLEEFYAMLNVLSVKDCRSVCDELGYGSADEYDPKAELVRRFKGGDVERIMSSLRAKRVKDKNVERKPVKDTIEVKDIA